MKKAYLFLVSVFVFFAISCNKWLDIKPEDKFIEEDVFSTPQGFMDALNGLYLNLGASNMYGKELTMTTFDLLAQYYYISPAHSAYNKELIAYNFEEDAVKNHIAQIWQNHYLAIANTNTLLHNLDKNGSILDEQTKNLFLGEALALRGFLYFEVLRAFAPTYTSDSTATLIPYYDKVTYEFSDFKTSKFVMESILEDLRQAEQLLLQYDPVLTETKVDKTMGAVEVGKKAYLTFRNYHLNYYAVKGLQARVNLWRGDKVSALAAAKAVIDHKDKFPWIKDNEINHAEFPNRIFSTELLFAVENPKLYQVWNSTFSSALLDQELLAAGTSPTPAFLDAVYEGFENDFRYSPMWDIEGGKNYRTFLKYKDIPNTVNRNFRFSVPMLRISEIFLIAAECETDISTAFSYLNEIRAHRNTHNVPESSDLQENIMKEYRKEFYGEGQLWFYYKRTLATNILSATNGTKNIDKQVYTFPIPLSETEPR